MNPEGDATHRPYETLNRGIFYTEVNASGDVHLVKDLPIKTKYSKGHEEDLARYLKNKLLDKREQVSVVVAWEHSKIVPLLGYLGVGHDKWDRDNYNETVILKPDESYTGFTSKSDFQKWVDGKQPANGNIDCESYGFIETFYQTHCGKEINMVDLKSGAAQYGNCDPQ